MTEKKPTLKTDLIKAFLVALIWSVFLSFPAYSQQVEVEIGPEFKADDAPSISVCYRNSWGLAGRFPFGILGQAPIPGSPDACPELTIFGNSFQFCEVIGIWQVIRPGVLIILLYQAIIFL